MSLPEQVNPLDRDILHLHIPAFAVAVVRILHPELRTCPVAVASPGGRGVVLAVSPEARAEGVRKGSAVAWATRVCPALRVIPPQAEAVGRVQGAIEQVARQYTPLWEPSRPGHLFLDLTGAGRLLGPPRDVAARVERDVLVRIGLVGSVGVAGNKLVSRVASCFLAQGGVCDVIRGNERAFLGPLPLDLLPGVGWKRRQVLAGWGVSRIEGVLGIPPAHLDSVFGGFGRVLRGLAAGEDAEPVRPAREAAVIERDEVLARDAADGGVLAIVVRNLLAQCCSELRQRRQVAGGARLRLGYEDGHNVQGRVRVDPVTAWDHELLPSVSELLIRLHRRRVRVRWLRLALERLSSGGVQLDLFRAGNGDSRRESLCVALDELRRRLGSDTVAWGRTSRRLHPAPV